MIESSITRNGQTTLPKVVRETLGLRAGDRVRYIISDTEVRILPVRPIARLFGALRHDGPTISVDEMEQSVASRAVEE
ncbi:MAG: AbrB/MazE/SpoVT family DNA-binding domain-containing protein [Candidatus Aminicenantes bacterium]|nr:AbrB/MazE/SpoVT family DNA-binding domain-containing protein [Candidatus Aminicenantes bacterium]